MKKVLLGVTALIGISSLCSMALADTKAYWRFEAGPADTNIIHTGAPGEYGADVVDVSGNGNDLAVWATGGDNGYEYRSEVAYSEVNVLGIDNTLSARCTGDNPGLWINTPDLQSWSPVEFTIEVTFKIAGDGYRTLIGRDSYGSASVNGDLAAVYFQGIPGNGIAFKFADVQGYWHEAVSDGGVITTFDNAVNPDGVDVPWYSAAAVCDGSSLKLYLFDHSNPSLGYQLLRETDMTISESTNTAMTTGSGDGGNWDAGDWSMGRGLYGGNHVDRAIGFLDEIRFSDVALEEKYLLCNPFQPIITNPDVELTPNVETQVVDATLSWEAAKDKNGNVIADISDQYLFMGNLGIDEDPNIVYIGSAGDPGSVAESSYDLALEFDDAYQWVIVDVISGQEPAELVVGETMLDDIDPNNIFSQVWTFQSVYSVPVITTQPGDTVVAENSPATFEVVAQSITPESYTWYMLTGEEIDLQSDLEMGTGTILTIADAGYDDEGYYYCSVVNESGISVETRLAELAIQKVVAHYAFDNDLLDSAGDNDGVAVLGDEEQPLVFVDPGKVNQSLSFNGNNQSVEVLNNYTKSFTVELWIKTNVPGSDGGGWYNGDGLFDTEMPGTQDDYGVALMGENFAFGVGVLGSADTTIRSATSVADDQWHWCLATRDHNTGDIAVYVDGEMEASATATTGVKDAAEIIRIGCLQTNGNFFEGQLDDIKVYNYAIDELGVADMYYTMTGIKPCISSIRPGATYDINDDCIVDVNDFADFASQWLDCAIYPTCVN